MISLGSIRLAFIRVHPCAPAFFSTALAAYLYYSGVENIIQPWSWLLLIVAIDVAHVHGVFTGLILILTN